MNLNQDVHQFRPHREDASSIPTLVTACGGKTGSRVARRLAARGVPTRLASRATFPSFDWSEPGTWDEALHGMQAAFVAYVPDLAFPGATDDITAFIERAHQAGMQRIVLLSGRGEPAAQAAEQVVLNGPINATVVRAAWFMQNFSEHFLLGPVLDGVIAIPAGDVLEPFVDVEDIADVAVAALTEPGHDGRIYEVTGPRLMSFAQAANAIGGATGRSVAYVPVTPAEYAQGAAEAGVPEEEVGPLVDLFTQVLDGRNAHISSGVHDALGREPADFADYVSRTAATGIWANTSEDVSR